MRASLLLFLVIVASGVSAASAGERALIDTTRSPHAKMHMVDLGDVKWTGGLLGERFAVCRTTMVSHMWTILKDDLESHAWSNFLIAAGLGKGRDGKFHGPPFNDGDFLKWPLRWSRTRTPNIKSSFCCPPNVVRTIAAAHNYVYALSADTLWVHLYAASALDTA